jgi:hypothetical protein
MDFETDEETLPASVAPGTGPASDSGQTSITFVSEESTDEN